MTDGPNHSLHVVDWLWRDGVARVYPPLSASMTGHKLAFVERDPWYCVLGVYSAWRHTRALDVKPLAAGLPVPF